MSGFNVKHYDAIGVNLKGNSQSTLSVSTSGAQTSAMAASADGIYDIWCDVDVWLKVSQSTASDVTSSTGYYLPAGQKVPVKLDDGDKLGAIASASGTLRYHRVS